MKASITIVVLAMMVAATLAAVAQSAPGPVPGAALDLRILSPHQGDKINTSFVEVRFEQLNGTVAGVPQYSLQFDTRDPVTTSSTAHTFTGVRPGNHVVRVQTIDANGTAIGPPAQVEFTVVPGPNPPASSLLPPALARDSESPALPSSGSELPLLSVIGFGVLVGGILSAMRGR